MDIRQMYVQGKQDAVSALKSMTQESVKAKRCNAQIAKTHTTHGIRNARTASEERSK